MVQSDCSDRSCSIDNSDGRKIRDNIFTSRVLTKVTILKLVTAITVVTIMAKK